MLATAAVTASVVLAISGTRTIEPGRAFGNELLLLQLLLVDGMLGGAFAIAHGSETVAGVDVLAVVLAADVVAGTVHVSCTGTTDAKRNCQLFIRVNQEKNDENYCRRNDVWLYTYWAVSNVRKTKHRHTTNDSNLHTI